MTGSSPLLTRQECEAIAKRVFALATADETHVSIRSAVHAHTRFGQGRISTAGEDVNTTVAVSSAFGKRMATITSNQLAAAALAELVKNAEALAKLSPENPEAMPALGAQTYAAVPARTLQLPSAADRAAAAQAMAAPVRRAGFMAVGFVDVRADTMAVATSRGLFAYGQSGGASATMTVRTPDGTGSGWAGAAADTWSGLDAAAIGARATHKASASRQPTKVEPGRYTVILEPQAAAELVPLMIDEMGARRADEGRSFFSRPGGGTKLGTKVVDERVTLVSDPADAGIPWTDEGLPAKRVPWIEQGILKNLEYGRYWAEKQQVPPTAAPDVLRMVGGKTSVPAMIAETERGILVTRFWYIRMVDPRTILYTGLTRDGTFLIENGKITHSAKNFRFNDSPVFMLNSVDTLSPAVRVNASGSGEAGRVMIMPAIKCRDFNFTSLSDAV